MAETKEIKAQAFVIVGVLPNAGLGLDAVPVCVGAYLEMDVV
jgi:hypothetical protein